RTSPPGCTGGQKQDRAAGNRKGTVDAVSGDVRLKKDRSQDGDNRKEEKKGRENMKEEASNARGFFREKMIGQDADQPWGTQYRCGQARSSALEEDEDGDEVHDEKKRIEEHEEHGVAADERTHDEQEHERHQQGREFPAPDQGRLPSPIASRACLRLCGLSRRTR